MTTLAFKGTAVVHGATIEVTEADRLTFSINQATEPLLTLGEDEVPLVRRGEVFTSDPDWEREGQTEHLVGRCPVVLRDGGSPVLKATLRRAPSRITQERYEWMLAQLASRAGLSALEDSSDRTRIWAMLAPDIPTSDVEEAMSAMLIWRRCAEAVHRVASNPVADLKPRLEFVSVRSPAVARARRISGRSIRAWDPPRPPDRPTEGVVLIEERVSDVDTPENRFVLGAVSKMERLLAKAARSGAPAASRVEAAAAAEGIRSLFGGYPWTSMTPGPIPQLSFILRDNPSYQTIVSMVRQIDRLPRLVASFDASSVGDALELSPSSLNVLYERWVVTEVIEWVEGLIGPFQRPAVPVTGSYSRMAVCGNVLIQIDEEYPNKGPDVHAPYGGKRRPDLAIEIHGPTGTRVAVIDPTYSKRNPIHQEKMQYAVNLVDGRRRDPIDGRGALCVEWVAAAYPGDRPYALVQRPVQAEAILSAPPGEDGREILHQWLASTVGPVLVGR